MIQTDRGQIKWEMGNEFMTLSLSRRYMVLN